MYVNGVGSGLTGVGSSSGPRPLGAPAPQPPGDSPLKKAESPQLSRRGQFMNKLQELEKTDPEQARKLLGELASRIRGEAQAGGANSERRLALADRLQQAADTGDFSTLEHGRGQGQPPANGTAMTKAYSQTMAMTGSSR
jgi:hypothetical protein